LSLALQVNVWVAADIDGDALDGAAGERVRVLAGVVGRNRFAAVPSDAQALDITRLPSGSAAAGFGGGAWDKTARGRIAGNRSGDGDDDQGGTLSSAGSHRDEQPSGAPDPPGQTKERSPRS
jgi:hypothetical protein